MFNCNPGEARSASNVPRAFAKELLEHTQAETMAELSRLEPETLVGAVEW